jgi:hypothetical protein
LCHLLSRTVLYARIALRLTRLRAALISLSVDRDGKHSHAQMIPSAAPGLSSSDTYPLIYNPYPYSLAVRFETLVVASIVFMLISFGGLAPPLFVVSSACHSSLRRLFRCLSSLGIHHSDRNRILFPLILVEVLASVLACSIRSA